jgi:hypothetical protein
MAWQPIETAPKGECVLLFSPDAADWYSVCVGYAISDEDGVAWYSQEESVGQPIDAQPSHWMPLPEPPEAKQ